VVVVDVKVKGTEGAPINISLRVDSRKMMRMRMRIWEPTGLVITVV
jgi:hypothetical protein